MKRSFISLAPRDALQVAIHIEERNAGLYHQFAEMFVQLGDEQSLEISAVFWEMAIEERGHYSLLRQKYAEQFGYSRSPVTDEDLIEVIELPKLDESAVFVAWDNGLPARNLALQVALTAEISAQSYYVNLVNKTPDGPLREIYSDLAKMEKGHATYLATKLGADAAED